MKKMIFLVLILALVTMPMLVLAADHCTVFPYWSEKERLEILKRHKCFKETKGKIIGGLLYCDIPAPERIPSKVAQWLENFKK